MLHHYKLCNSITCCCCCCCCCCVAVQVGKAWAPSIVFIGDCEKSWQKKVPKTDKVKSSRS